MSRLASKKPSVETHTLLTVLAPALGQAGSSLQALAGSAVIVSPPNASGKLIVALCVPSSQQLVWML